MTRLPSRPRLTLAGAALLAGLANAGPALALGAVNGAAEPAARAASPAAVAAVTAAVAATPEANLRVSYHTRQIGSDGVERETRHVNRVYRRAGMVWTERELPAALAASQSHGHAHAHGPHAGHAHDEAQGAPLRVSRDAEGREKVEVILTKTRRVIDVDRAHHGNVGYAGSWDNTYWLVPPAMLQKMTRVGPAKAGVQRYRSVGGEVTTTVDWDVAGQYPRRINRSNAHGTESTDVVITRVAAPQPLPWKASESYGVGDYSDLLD